MKRVKYVAMIDLDEMLLPVSTGNWPDMLRALEKHGGRYASFTFSNNFFEEVNEAGESIGVCPKAWGGSKYFSRLNRLPWPPNKQKTKMKMIVRADVVSSTCIHDVCKPVVRGWSKTYRVPSSTGIMAHYREPVPKWYIFGKGTKDPTALKFRTEMEAEMREKCVLLASQVT